MRPCASEYLPALLLRRLWNRFRVPNRIHLTVFGNVSEKYSATVRVTGAVVDSGSRFGSLVPK